MTTLHLTAMLLAACLLACWLAWLALIPHQARQLAYRTFGRRP